MGNQLGERRNSADRLVFRLAAGLLASAIALLVMIAVSLWGWQNIDTERIATHWNAAGEADGYSPKAVGLMLGPMLAIAVAGVIAVASRVDPRKDNLARSSQLLNAAWIGAVLVVTLLHVMVVLNAAGHEVPVASMVLAAVGALFVLVGNYLPKTRPNWSAGIRTPWTLSDDRVWFQTHRLAGRLFVAFGLCVMASAALGADAAMVVVAGGAAVAAAVTAYSYIAWRRCAQS